MLKGRDDVGFDVFWLLDAGKLPLEGVDFLFVETILIHEVHGADVIDIGIDVVP